MMTASGSEGLEHSSEDKICAKTENRGDTTINFIVRHAIMYLVRKRAEEVRRLLSLRSLQCPSILLLLSFTNARIQFQTAN